MTSLSKWILGIAVVGILAGGALVVHLLRATPADVAPTVLAPTPEPYPKVAPIGSSVEGRTIDSFTYGTGPIHLAFVGGVHGGYEWNAVLLAYQLMDYLQAHPEAIPASESVTIIPDVNPDAVHKVTGVEGRFTLADIPKGTDLVPDRYNAHMVDLNRNFDCNWQPKSSFLGKVTSAGTTAFSEPEAQAIKNFVASTSPKVVAFFHSKSGAVYASQCHAGILPQTLAVTKVYAKAAGYRAINIFDAYPITGDAEGWLASLSIPAITVELTTHDSVEFDKNLAGVKALIAYMASSTPAKP